ncbi:phage tail tip lysozyme [Acinetobacter soli]|uniref:phage tail tip lysozyme n=1 Tax=Acinetobacter soli TaxID=487316 RepID=UPI003A88A346
MAQLLNLNTDAHGFIIGDSRLKQIADGVEKTRDNTQIIVELLTNSFKKSIEAEGDKTRRTIRRAATDTTVQNPISPKPTAREASPNVDNSPTKNQDRGRSSFVGPRAIEATQTAGDRARKDRERDHRGRFIGANGDKAETESVLSKINATLSDMRGLSGDGRGYDPTIDALGELKDFVAPIGSVFSKMSTRAVGLFRGRLRKRRNEEVLPEEQVRANRNNEKNDKERNKLLRRLIEAVMRKNGTGSSGFSSLLGSLTKGRGKTLLKRIPFLGLLFGGGLLANDWGGLNSAGKGKGLGELGGGATGAALGSFFGPVGTVAGSALGMYLGGIFGRKVGEWTDGLKREDFGKIFEKIIKDLAAGTFSFATNPVSTLRKGASTLWESAQQGVYDLTGGRIGNDVNSPIGKNTTEKQVSIYNSMRKAGFSKNQAIALTASVGRENDYNDNNLFGTHYDAANGAKNMGMISWQGDRQKRLQQFMSKRGLIDRSGNIIKGQASLNAQAEFMKWEIDNDPKYTLVKDYLTKNPNASREDLARVFGKGYVKWAYGQDVLKNGKSFDWRKHLGKEYNYSKNLEKSVSDSKPASTEIPKSLARPAASTQAVVNPKGAEITPSIQVPKITPDISKIGTKKDTTQKIVMPNQDSIISQNVSDRSLAHILTGGIGFIQNQ